MRIVIINATWCLSCLFMNPIYKKLESQYSNLDWNYYDIDFDENSKLYEVKDKLPVFIILKNDKEQSRLIGEKSEKEISQLIEKYLQVKS